MPEAQTNIEQTSNENVEIASKNPSDTESIVQTPIEQVKSDEISKSVKSDLEPMKFSADEIKQTDDIIIKYTEKPVTEIVSSVQEAETVSNNTINDVKDKISAEQNALKEAQIEEQKRLKAEEKAAKQATIKAQKELKAQQKALKQAKIETEEAAAQVPKVIKSASKAMTDSNCVLGEIVYLYNLNCVCASAVSSEEPINGFRNILYFCSTLSPFQIISIFSS